MDNKIIDQKLKMDHSVYDLNKKVTDFLNKPLIELNEQLKDTSLIKNEKLNEYIIKNDENINKITKKFKIV